MVPTIAVPMMREMWQLWCFNFLANELSESIHPSGSSQELFPQDDALSGKLLNVEWLAVALDAVAALQHLSTSITYEPRRVMCLWF